MPSLPDKNEQRRPHSFLNWLLSHQSHAVKRYPLYHSLGLSILFVTGGDFAKITLQKAEGSMVRALSSAGIFKQSMGARNRVGYGLSYRPARLHRLAEFIAWNRFLGFINV